MAKKTLETNPFVQSFEISALWRLEMDSTKLEDGESGRVTQAKVKIVDTDDRVSVYTHGLLGWFADLPSSAKDMFMYISTYLKWERDVIEIEEERYCETMGVSRNTFYSAKTALTNRLIIPRTSRKNTYWVNPAYLFKGNRITTYPANVKMMNENPLEKLRG